MRRIRFISFEGVEGCGKSTQIHLLSEYLTGRSIPHIVTREPGGTPVGESIRRILVDSATSQLTAEAELLLFFASRSQNIRERIRPAMDRGELVIADRFFDASLAYQGFGRGLSLDLIRNLTSVVCRDTRPELTFLLDLAPEVGLQRARSRNTTQSLDEGRFESEDIEFYRRVREGYTTLASEEPERFVRIQAEGTPQAIHRSILSTLDARI